MTEAVHVESEVEFCAVAGPEIDQAVTGESGVVIGEPEGCADVGTLDLVAAAF